MSRSYADAVCALNSLQSNFAVVEEIRKSGRGLNQQAIPEMIEWSQRIGYEPDDFSRLNLIHIAGTKGKGSTSAFVSSILSQYLATAPGPGRGNPIQAIGLYTSPHLRFVRERIQINNIPLSEEKFARYFFETWDRLEASARSGGRDPATKPVYFRFLTLVAFHTYMSEGVTTAVIECGIGGEYDSTNIITRPAVTGITNLAIDHTGLLGESIEEIAWHKAGIMKKGTKCFTVPQKPAAMIVLEDRAREKGIDLETVPVHAELQSGSVPLGLSASFQKANASLAIAIAKHVLSKYGFQNVSIAPLNQDFKRGLKEVRWGGRCETRHEAGITWYIDGGHTLESIELVGQWFAGRIRPHHNDDNDDNDDDNHNTVPPSADTQKQQQRPRILIFNQQTRDANALATSLHKALTAALGSTCGPIFTHAIFCPNTAFKAATAGANSANGSRRTPDLVAKNTDLDAVRELSVQKALASKWRELDPDADVRVVESVEEAVHFVRALPAVTEAAVVAVATKEEKKKKKTTTTTSGRPEDSANAKPTALVTGSLHLVGAFLEVLN